MLIGVGQTDPDANQQKGPSQGGALKNAQAGGGSANSQVVLPRHRATVERFFVRPNAQAKKN